ncbi:MAG: hypothetical protein HZA46_24505, partial [Planctomycetales bacterium]|nr:hypothetical protein [Planctomycetales bacterium]
SRYWDVNLGQVETTTILTNNRTFAKVSPSATMEFDLPQRDILITEAMKGSQALVQQYGQLMQDPTFLAATKLQAGQTADGLTSSQSPLQTIQGGGTPQKSQLGAPLQALIPDPAVYKFETGTGFEIRPVIQPDGHSIVYGFDYMYTTNVREPIRADEKHLGRVKQHFVHTDVQTSSYELREVSRYTVALKASRTSRGVPLLEDVPLVGGLFRPMPSDESSLQQNIILASSVIYPTLFDLAGLRWSPYADEIHSGTLAQTKQREAEIKRRYRDNLLNKARATVSQNIGGDLELPPPIPSSYRESAPLLEELPAIPSSRPAFPNSQHDSTGEQELRSMRPRPQTPAVSYTAPMPIQNSKTTVRTPAVGNPAVRSKPTPAPVQRTSAPPLPLPISVDDKNQGPQIFPLPRQSSSQSSPKSGHSIQLAGNSELQPVGDHKSLPRPQVAIPSIKPKASYGIVRGSGPINRR